MNKIVFILLLGMAATLHGQKVAKSAIDLAVFDQKQQIARWLCAYERVAQQCADSIAAWERQVPPEVGSLWFCVEESSAWHIVFVRYRADVLEVVRDGRIDANGRIVPAPAQQDTARLHRLARALHTVLHTAGPWQAALHSGFRPYLREETDQQMTVHILPMPVSEALAWDGRAFACRTDATGRRLLQTTNTVAQASQPIGLYSSADVLLQYLDAQEPPIAAIFFALYHAGRFRSVTIQTSQALSRWENSRLAWTHSPAPDTKPNK